MKLSDINTFIGKLTKLMASTVFYQDKSSELRRIGSLTKVKLLAAKLVTRETKPILQRRPIARSII